MLGNTVSGEAGLNTVEEVKAAIDDLIEANSLPSDVNLFQQVANGFYQAEGYLGVTFSSVTSSLTSPLMSVSQNVSQASLRFMVTLYLVLGKTGTFAVSVTQLGKLHITLRTGSWDTILNVWIPFFNQVSGAKYIGFLSLARIFAIRLDRSLDSIFLIVQLAYSMNSGQFKLSLNDKLLAMGLTPTYATFSPLIGVNNVPLTLAFFLGLFLGDGYSWIRLRITKGSLLIIPIISISQKLTDLNSQLMIALSNLLTSLGISNSLLDIMRNKSYNGIVYDASCIVLTIEGLTSVLSQLLPQLLALQEFFYWKSTQLNALIVLNTYISVSAHLLIPGLISLVHFVFSIPTYLGPEGKSVTLSMVLAQIELKLSEMNARTSSGQYMITAENTPQGMAYRVRFPAFMFGKIRSAQFLCKHSCPVQALADAVSHRDTVINDWLTDKLGDQFNQSS